MVAVTVEGLSPEEVPADLTDLIRVLDADASGQNVNTAQPWFPTSGAVAVEAGLYEFEGQINFTRSAGTTSHTTSILFGGTATVSNIMGSQQGNTGDAVISLSSLSTTLFAVATDTPVKASSTSATEQALMRVRGIIRISVAGTLIPQFKYSAAPGGVPTIKRNTFFRLRKLGVVGLTAIGTWS